MNFERVRRMIQNEVPDLKDNLPSVAHPATAIEAIERPEEAAPLLENLVPSITRAQMLESIERLPVGTSRARIVVGTQEKGTRHPHDFVVDKEGGASELYFVDPEHQMGKSKRREGQLLPRRGEIRPKVATLIGFRLAPDASIDALSVIRFRTKNIADQHVLKMSEQLKTARELLKTAELPEFLQGNERDITFRIEVRPDTMRAESRYASSEQLAHFLTGHADNAMLKGKVWGISHLMAHFAKHLGAGRFEPISPVAE